MNTVPVDILNIVSKYKKKIEDKFTVKQCYIYGSYAHGKHREDSDIDVCIVASSNVPKEELWDFLLLSTDEIDYRIEPIGYTEDRFIDEIPIVWEIKRTGV
jgi:uncharacterized protein